jgi:hypothetical protein
MKRFYFSKLAFVLALIFGSRMNAGAQTTFSFAAGCGVQTFVVQPGVFSVAVDMYGARGGADYNNWNQGGYGGRVQCTLATTPGQVLNIIVGGQGGQGGCCTMGGSGFGGCNGGGSEGYYLGGGGGGASDIRVGGTSVANRVVVAGGGGGAGYYTSSGSAGGLGGGLSGGMGSGYFGTNLGYCGSGGSQTGPGAGGTYCYCPTGSPGVGAVGGNGGGYGSGAGGGGYFGGGGASYYAGGGGGSSYTDPTLCTAVTHTQGYTSALGNGQVAITPICTPPTPGSITGTSVFCGGGINSPLSFTGSGGGVWTSSDITVATVSNTGVIHSIANGAATITYSLTYSCGSTTTTYPITVLSGPGPILPINPTICTGNTTTLSDAGGGTWASSNTFVATIDPSSGVVTGIYAGTTVITYTLPSTCTTTTTLVVNSSPAGIGGPPSVCSGAAITLADATAGGTWSSSSPAVATIDAVTGVVSGLAGGNTTTITYTVPNSCVATKVIAVNTLPSVFSLAATPGSGHYCVGSAGVALDLSNSASGINYQLYQGTAPYSTAVPGTGGSLSFGSITAVGTYSVLATDATTGCSSDMTGSITIVADPLPNVYTLSFSGSSTAGFCSPGGASPDLILPFSDPGVLYYLYLNGISTGSFLIGGTGALDFGPQSAAGVYTVIAVNASSGCLATMSGTPTLTMNLAPDVHTVTQSGSTYCPYDAGVHIGLDYSNVGITYNLYDGGSSPIATTVGSSSTLDFGVFPAGTYTVQAVNTTTGCTTDMSGSANVTVSSLPNAYPVFTTGSSSYCAGGTGVDIQVGLSDYGVNYQLLNGTTPVGSPMAGNSGTLDFGNQTTAGSYSVQATDLTTTCVASMSGGVTVTINALPTVDSLSASNGGHYCAGTSGAHLLLNTSDPGVNYDLYNSVTGLVASMPGSGAPIDFGSFTTNGSYTAIATNTVTSCVSNMQGSPSVMTDALPDVDSITGGGSYCLGGPGKPIGLDYSNLGITYQLFNGATPVGSPVVGSNSGLDFGFITAAGTYSVQATNPITGCTQSMFGNATININTPPASFVLTSSSSGYCSGGAGVDMMLSGSQPGIYYQLFNAGSPLGSTIVGAGTSLDFGFHPETGAYTVVAVDSTSLCTSNMSGSPVIHVDPLPTAYTVSGGGVFCAGGTGVHVGLTSSTPGISYQLYSSAGAVGSAVTGTGGSVDFGLQTAANTYSVIATNPTTTCTNAMNGSVTISTNPVPVAYSLTGGGNYCAGGTGVHIGLAGSSSGVTYQLLNGATPVGSAVAGSTGTTIDYGLQTAAGTYTILATDIATGCTSGMTGSTTINVNPVPVLYTTFGGGSYCAGGTGVNVYLSGSSSGINYQLLNGGSPVGGAMSGTGAMIDFGMQTAAGTYNVVATDPVTSCASNMVAAATITINPLPIVYSVTGGGSYCAGGAGVNIGLGLSNAGISYQLFNGTTAVGSPLAGAGISLNFGPQTTAGTYHVVATDAFTGCVNNMSGTAAVNINPAVTPAVSFSSGSSPVCAGNTATFVASAVNGGATPFLQWSVNGVLSGTGSTYTYVPANGDIVAVMLTSSAACATPATANAMQTMTLATPELPTATISVAPGTTICPGTSVTFTPSNTFGGTSPLYWWLKNSVVVSTGSSYTYTPASGDVVVLMMKSSYSCRSVDTVFSNTELFDVIPTPVPVVSIAANPGTTVAFGQPVTLTANVTNAGDAPTFQWFRNSSAIPGAVHPSITSSSFSNGDSISCVVTAMTTCGIETSFNAVKINMYTSGVKPVSSGLEGLTVVPNPNKGTFVLKGSLSTSNDAEIEMEMTNMIGQVVYKNTAAVRGGKVDEQVQLGNALANGMYILNVRSENGNAVFHVVIEK